MLTLFWDETGVILEHYTRKGNTVTGASYSDLLLNHLRPAIKSKRRGLLSSGVLLQHDNARPHTARTTVATITDLHFECIMWIKRENFNVSLTAHIQTTLIQRVIMG